MLYDGHMMAWITLVIFKLGFSCWCQLYVQEQLCPFYRNVLSLLVALPTEVHVENAFQISSQIHRWKNQCGPLDPIVDSVHINNLGQRFPFGQWPEGILLGHSSNEK